ncbi:MAG: AmmeMemoRadiSam system protein B [Thermotoga caldifontis]|uniref:AmmeMemoRadiSam system protein B n=1 Tax=Thermotoga caldifontis TaxID=1508419 RepID=UPI003C7A43F0
MRRSPVVSGSFYPASVRELTKLIEICFTSELGPGELPKKPEKLLERCVGLIVPHAGYIYSGPVAAHGYLEAAKFGNPKLVVLLGPNHTGYGARIGVWSEGSWSTPLGEVRVCSQAAELFLNNCKEASADVRSHMAEHSLEVQLPFLQYVFKDFEILPITMFPVGLTVCRSVANALDQLLRDHPSTLVIASSDFNHYEDDRTTRWKDQLAIDEILKKDPEGLYQVVARERITMCGLSPVASLLYMQSFSKVRLLKHATSGDTSGDRSHVVGYASFIFE